MKKFVLVAIVLVFPVLFITKQTKAQTGQLEIQNITDNKTDYTNSSVPKFEKIEITFDIENSVATNMFFPYDPDPPLGLESGQGITVNAKFTDPDGKTHIQPAFYYQEFEREVKNNNDWLYPTAIYKWKVRFSPNKTGSWKYQLYAEDDEGTVQTSEVNFNVVESSHHGPVKVSSQDVRYFEHEDGTYFPALGFNLNAGNLDFINPLLGNVEEFSAMGENGIQLSRVWISQKSIYGSAYGAWFSPNRAHIKNEAIMGLIQRNDAQLTAYANLTSPPDIFGSDYFMWLNYDTTVAGDGQMYKFTPCRLLGFNNAPVTVKRNTNYRIRVRYNAQGFVGPKVSGQPYGFTVKEGGWLWHDTDETKRCDYPGMGTVLAATYQRTSNDPWTDYSDPENPGWRILEGYYNSGDKDFIQFLYLSLENLSNSPQNQSSGHVFVENIWMEEDLGGGNYGPNIIYKPDLDHHTYVSQRDAYALDKVLELAGEHDVYLKMVMLEKNDYIFTTIKSDGTLAYVKDSNYFYGNGRELAGETKVRWLQKAWWRYMQGRWGYSENVHSWELLNEGPPGPTDGPHWILADEFGKFMHCGVFEINSSNACDYDHPNDHLVTTSFFSGGYPYHFWRNTSGNYPNIDYADIHEYADEGEEGYFDSALFTKTLSDLRGAKLNTGAGKPIIRGEVAWQFSGSDPFASNQDSGVWLHNFIWGGINPNGLIEHFFAGGSFTNQIYKKGKNEILSHDHRPKFGNYYRFIKDIPLNNGNYVDAEAISSNANIRVWGQKDMINQKAHIWVQNIDHTWKNVVDGVNINPQSSEVKISGFSPNSTYKIEEWDTNSGTISSTKNITSDSNGQIAVFVNNLSTDTAFRIGDYDVVTPTSIPSVPGDANADGIVDGLDYVIWLINYDTDTQNGASKGDFNNNGHVDGIDYVIWLNNYSI